MAWSFPLGLDDFFGPLPVWEQTFDLAENTEVSGLADGSILQDEIGPRLWRGKVSIDLLTFEQARAVEAKIALLQGPGRSFLVYRKDCAAPALDPTGSELSGYWPSIHSLQSNGRELQLQGLPGGYDLVAGDMLAFAYGSAPTRHALHRVVSNTVTANGSTGITPMFEVVPNIRPGAEADAAVSLLRPCCKAVIVPGSVSAGTVRRNRVRGLSFDFIQTLR